MKYFTFSVMHLIEFVFSCKTIFMPACLYVCHSRTDTSCQIRQSVVKRFVLLRMVFDVFEMVDLESFEFFVSSAVNSPFENSTLAFICYSQH